jgi:IclR family acetate operon transcriptional repressor
MGQDEGRYNIRAVDRGLLVLSVLSDGKPRTLTDLSEEIALNSSTTFRLLATLAYHNYVERDEQSGEYRLGLACLELARAYHAGNTIRRAALPQLERLRDDSTETVHLGVLNNMEVVYLEKLHGLHAVGLMTSRVGGRAPAYCTGLGKALLAYADPQKVREYFEQNALTRYTSTTIQSLDELITHLEQIRRQGYAFDQGEHEADVRCVAVPIFDTNGQAVAALSVSGPSGRLDPLETKPKLIERTREAARNISARLGYNLSE